MILTDPTDFDAVIKLINDKNIFGTPLKSWQIARLREQFNIRGLFSAQTLNTQLLGGYQEQLKEMASGQMDIATARWHMKDLIDELDIKPPSEEEAGTLTDLGSNRRINLVLKTNLEMARGFGQYAEGMTEGALVAFPALELIRVEERAVPREWFDIWDDAADELGDETTATDADETGRMVAKKGDPIWLEISDFGQPWPPFKFNSGMGVEDVDREEAIELEVVEEDDLAPDPEQRDFNDDVEAGVEQVAAPLVKVLAEGLQGIAKQVGNAFRLLPPKPAPVTEDPDSDLVTVTIPNAREHAEEVLALLDNMGTHEGAVAGWITRRAGGPLSARRVEKMRVRRQIKQGRQALRRTLSSRSDQNGAMQVSGAGSVDFDYGRPGKVTATKDDGYGISHLEAKHPDRMNQLPRTLAKGQVFPHEDPKKLYVVHKDNVAILRRKTRGDGSSMQSRYGVVSHFQDIRKARELSPASLSNTRQVLLEEFLSLEGYSSRPTFVADGEGCCQDRQPTTPAFLRQRGTRVLELLAEAA